MAVGWVIDHPAHARLLAPLMRELSGTDDVIVACERQEVRAMIENCDGHLPRRRTVWVPRPVGKGRWRKAWRRSRISKRALKDVQQVVSIGAAIETMVAPRKSRRIYITDTEINHTAHRIAKPTDIVVPTHFIDSLSGPLLKKRAKIHRIDGLHGHIHLRPQLRPKQVSDPPKVLVRRLKGGGIHDEDELLSIPEKWLDGFDLTYADENEFAGNPWELDRRIAGMDGVITQSVTLASEAVLLGVPTLLVSRAKRGFINRLADDGYPLFVAGVHDDEIHTQWMTGIHLTDALQTPEWPDTKQELLQILF